ncbi:hypothetical protein L7F22_037590 [Adiantum nelumboides]|nr:hypothetical protein [Adiantum nelumboides]
MAIKVIKESFHSSPVLCIRHLSAVARSDLLQAQAQKHQGFALHGAYAEIETLWRLGELDRAILALRQIAHHGAFPSGKLLFALLQACFQKQAVSRVLSLHVLMAFCQLDTSLFLGDYLVSTLVSCGSIEDALRILRRLPHGSVYSWTCLISECVACGRYENGLAMYRSMMEDCVQPNAHTFVSLLKACAATCDLIEGMLLHDCAERTEVPLDGHVGSALINMYGKCWCTSEAEKVFAGLQGHDSISWNALVSVYIEQCDGDRAMQAFKQMQVAGAYENKQTHLIALRACCASAEKEAGILSGTRLLKLRSLENGRALHVEAEKKGFASDIFVCSTLVSMYGKCGSTSEAKVVYMSLAWHDVVSGTAILSAYLEQKQGRKVLQYYRQIPDVDKQMIVVSLQACYLLAEEPEWQKGALEIGRAIHADCRRKGLLEIFVGSAIVTLYGKCACLAEAELVFSLFTSRDVSLFNALLAIYVEQGKGERALQLYRQMHVEGLSPDDRTLVRALQACGKFVKRGATSIMKDSTF